VEHDALLLDWTEKLTRLNPERVATARDEVASWEFPNVSAALLAENLDGYIACPLLVEAMHRLGHAGIDHSRLLKKLRTEPDAWSTWAEFRVASSLLELHLSDAELRLEEGKSAGAHADFRFLLRQAKPLSVEVKAVGLSDEEAEFCERMGPSLPMLLPKEGLGHVHAPVDGDPPKLNRDTRRFLDREAKRRQRSAPMWARGLHGAVIAAHDSEVSYARRVGQRVAKAARQLPTSDDGWVAIHWSNGAPIQLVRESIPWDEIPDHVHGVFLVGCGVVFPHRQIHCFATPLPRDLPAGAELGVISVDPAQDDLATLVLDLFERSSGVRATLLQVRGQKLLLRDGSVRFFPFSLLMAPDPEPLGRHATDAPWMRNRPGRNRS
jgi:hypothetical protein